MARTAVSLRAVLAVLVGAITLFGGLALPAAAGPAGTETLVVGVDHPAAARSLAGAGFDVEALEPGVGALRVEVPAARAEAARLALARHAGVSYVEPDHPVQAQLVPTDPFWSYQWGPRKISAPAAWDVTTGASSVVIAVLDTGVSPGPEFGNRLLAGIDLVNGDSDAADDNGHGTSVAMVAAAGGSDGVGVAGMCWTCRILPVKVLDSKGAGSSSDIAQGIAWATDRGADVIIMSLGGPSSSTAVQSAVDRARQSGAVVVAAAGNSGSTTPTYPAALTGVIGVGASTSSDTRYGFSDHGSWVDVAAPGCNGAYVAELGYYTEFCGTSSATPLVGGAAALALAVGGAPTVVEDALRSTSAPLSWVAHGRIDAAATLTAVQAAVVPPPTGGTSPAVTVHRAAGDDRIATSVALADRAFPNGSRHLVLGRSDAYADALAAAPLAASLDAPVVLTAPDRLRDDVRRLIGRLGVTDVVLVGGTGAISARVADDLRAAGVPQVRRISGVNRFDTARLVAQELGGTEAYLVEGANADPARGWPDAVAVSGLAALQRRPILLTTSGSLPKETAAAIDALGTTTVTIVGGTAAVSDTVAAAVSSRATVRRISGATRYDTSTKLAGAAKAAGADDGTVWLATGRSFPDALAAGAGAGHARAVLLLVDGVDPKASPQPVDWLAARTALREVVLVGGTSTVSSAVEQLVTSRG
jgi:putative cell wall-binding protein